MEIRFSPHAELKIYQRKLFRERIIDTVLHPDFSKPGYNKREQLFKDFGKKNFMKVVVMRGQNYVTIVTAHWVANNKKK